MWLLPTPGGPEEQSADAPLDEAQRPQLSQALGVQLWLEGDVELVEGLVVRAARRASAGRRSGGPRAPRPLSRAPGQGTRGSRALSSRHARRARPRSRRARAASALWRSCDPLGDQFTHARSPPRSAAGGGRARRGRAAHRAPPPRHRVLLGVGEHPGGATTLMAREPFTVTEAVSLDLLSAEQQLDPLPWFCVRDRVAAAPRSLNSPSRADDTVVRSTTR